MNFGIIEFLLIHLLVLINENVDPLNEKANLLDNAATNGKNARLPISVGADKMTVKIR